MGDNERGTVNHCVASHFGFDAELRGYPSGWQPEHRLNDVIAGELCEVVGDHQNASSWGLATTDFNPMDAQNVGSRWERGIVAGADCRHHESELRSDLATQSADTVEQITAARAIDEFNEIDSEVELKWLHAGIDR